jgi:hypothetical protein
MSSETIRYYNDIEQKHRTNGPAVEWESGDWHWYLNSWCHRYYGLQCNPEFSHNDQWWLHGTLIKVRKHD